MGNPVLNEAVNALRDDILKQMAAVRLDDKDGHTRLIMALQMASAVQRQLWLLIQDGQASKIDVRAQRID